MQIFQYYSIWKCTSTAISKISISNIEWAHFNSADAFSMNVLHIVISVPRQSWTFIIIIRMLENIYVYILSIINEKNGKSIVSLISWTKLLCLYNSKLFMKDSFVTVAINFNKMVSVVFFFFFFCIHIIIEHIHISTKRHDRNWLLPHSDYHCHSKYILEPAKIIIICVCVCVGIVPVDRL